HPHTHDHGQPSAGDVENKDIEILGILLDHWVTHNQDHAMEYNTWVEKMNRLGKNEVAEDIIEAMALIVEADKHLAAAKKALLS
ncbi:MAG: zinc transporter, partial [Eubacteriaceae bacterium]|nr:zinc transporter [Eubacteriaceae bacterium]